MRRKKMLIGVLTAALLVGCISPLGVTGTEVPEEVRAEQLVILDETERQKEEALTAEEDVKSAEADENGFIIRGDVLTGYTGDGGDVTIPNGVRTIEEEVFDGSSSLTSITIPSSVMFINTNFEECSSLTAINVLEGNENYTSEKGILYNVDKDKLIRCPEGKIGEIIIPASVTSIGNTAFRGCSSLTSITIPTSVTSIGNTAFRECSGLTGITIPASVTNIGIDAFFGCSSLTSITISDNVMNIGESAFGGCSKLTEINVSEKNKNYTSKNGILYNVGKSTLIQCPGGKIGEIIIPDDVTSIEENAFQNCSSLTSIIISDSVTSIGMGAFSRCSSLTSITIPASVTSIGNRVFEGCSALNSITIFASVTSIGYNAFKDCSSLTSVTIPASVTSIEESAFEDCSSLTSVTIPASVTNIRHHAFEDCRSLNSITIPASVMSIGWYAFFGCSRLTSITIPDSVTSIGMGAFSRCSRLTSIIIPASVTDIGDDAFYDCSENLIIYCTENSYAETYVKENNIKYRYIEEKDTQTITVSDNITKIFGDSPFPIDAVTNGDGALSYVSDNEAVVKVDSAGTITLVGAGTAHITIIASETDTYKAAEKVITITVGKKAQTITASDITKTVGDVAFSLNAAVDGDGALTYVSDNTSVATVDANGTVTLVNAGTIHITIKASETTNYKAAEKIITVTVNPSETPSEDPEENEQTITAKDITKTYGDKPFSLGAKTNGGGKLTYKISNTKIATIDKKGKVTIKGCGRTQIKITAAENGNYQEATKTIILTVKPKKVAVTSVKSTKSKALTVKWKQDKKAKGYIIEYSTDKKFKKNVKTATISKNSTVSKTVTKLKGGKKYYVRVCAYTTADGKKIKGNYSKVMNIKVKK